MTSSSRRNPPRLLAITDRSLLVRSDPAGGSEPEPRAGSFDGWLDLLAQAGVDAVQIREKDLPDRQVAALARRARERLPPRVAVLINGRMDIALATNADGVHLPASGLPADALRRWAADTGCDILIGRSTHTPGEVEAAQAEGADYVTFGPVFPTPSKARYGPPPGPGELERATGVGIPVLALGGVDEEALETVARAGATGAAGIRVFHDPRSLARLSAEAQRVWGPVVDSPDESTR